MAIAHLPGASKANTPFYASLVIAVVAAAVALWLAFNAWKSQRAVMADL